MALVLRRPTVWEGLTLVLDILEGLEAAKAPFVKMELKQIEPCGHSLLPGAAPWRPDLDRGHEGLTAGDGTNGET